ncbi:MAG: metal-sensitive transcriptional regulator [Ilumatobacter sp.]|uniref:metal-sensitive transcriptional regulator n=1 Tax=Ilumatobacter sp. TaxID=1967498 RepID=UPI00391D56B5
MDEDRSRIDVLTPISSVTSALRGVGLGLLDQHLRTCVRDATTDDADQGDDEIAEAVTTVERLLRR